MAEKPILFSGPLVRAIWDDKKTQTRRIVKGQVDEHPAVRGAQVLTLGRNQFWLNSQTDHPKHAVNGCPYGKPGDRLWVRETFRPSFSGSGEIFYAADHNEYECREKGPWKPGIHMPRSACRLLLDVVSVRVERLKDITEEDARAEGVLSDTEKGVIACEEDLHPGGLPWARTRFAALWDEINGERSPWASNPWVWVVGFRRVA